MTTRKTNIKWGDKEVELAGNEVKVGQKAPDFTLIGNDMKPITLKDTTGKVRILSALPSLDTGVCDTETRRFNTEAAKIPGVDILTVSMDLPFAQKRWCVAETVANIGMLSDFRDHSFGYAYGVRMKEKGLLARSIFIIGRDGVVRYVQIVPDGTSEPDYDDAMTAAQAVAAGA